MRTAKLILKLVVFFAILFVFEKELFGQYFGQYYPRYNYTPYQYTVPYNYYTPYSYNPYSYSSYSSPSRYRTYLYSWHLHPSSKNVGKYKEKIKEKYSKSNLLKEVKSHNSLKREESAELLSRFSQESEVKTALESALDDPSPSVRNKAIKSLLASEDSYPLQKMVRNLGQVPFANSQENILILGRVLCSSRDPIARKEAAASLGNLKSLLALSMLKTARNRDANLMVQQQIVESMRKIQNVAVKEQKTSEKYALNLYENPFR